MIDFRLYRAAFLPALIALVVVAFSLDGVPGPLPKPLAPSLFEPREALTVARQIAAKAPEREPGSEGDAAVADLVERRLGEIPSAIVSDQRYDSTYEGDDVSLRNVIVTLPGKTDATIAIVAARDAATAPGAASSAAATGTLVTLAQALAATDHTKTIVLVSTDGGADGASGARQFADHYEARDSIQSTLVISEPGAAERSQPYLVSSSASADRASLGLAATAADEIATSAGTGPSSAGFFTQLARSAFPSGLGEQAVLIADGIDAIAISSAGERPLPPSRDGTDDLSGRTMKAFGQAALTTALALDSTPAPPDHGPDSYLVLGSNVVPAGALSLLALALLLPAVVAAVDGIARASRDQQGATRGLLWAGSMAAPLLAALVLLYLLALSGLIPRPAFPFDPRLFGFGLSEGIALGVLGVVAVGGYAFLGLHRPPPAATRAALLPAAGLVLFAGALGAWLANPFLGLVLVPIAHVWLPPSAWRLRRIGATAAVAIAAAPAVAAATAAAGAIGAGPWDVTLIVADGQTGAFTCVAICLIAAAALGTVIAAGSAITDRGY
jgi:Peptidase family M28